MSRQGDDKKTKRSDKAYDKWVEGIARGVLHIEGYLSEIQEERPTLTELRVKCDPDDEEGVLVVFKGYLGGQECVAFHRDGTISAALTGAGNRLRNGSLAWREAKAYVAK